MRRNCTRSREANVSLVLAADLRASQPLQPSRRARPTDTTDQACPPHKLTSGGRQTLVANLTASSSPSTPARTIPSCSYAGSSELTVTSRPRWSSVRRLWSSRVGKTRNFTFDSEAAVAAVFGCDCSHSLSVRVQSVSASTSFSDHGSRARPLPIRLPLERAIASVYPTTAMRSVRRHRHR